MLTTTTAEEHWHQYRERRLPDTYKQTRNGLLHADDSSRLSPWLSWGCISPRRVADDLRIYEERYGANDGTYWLWFELLWRDFFSLRAEHRGVLLDNVDVDLSDVGHPFVNAGLRELTETGFMSNRMRQIVASYCIYEANIPWQVGAAHFAEHLIDHDPASNIGNWKYIAGTGADPRGGRRFNIEKQREMYDADGAYLQRWGGR
jgi:deoxyribodipyrimidine photo-lyase